MLWVGNPTHQLVAGAPLLFRLWGLPFLLIGLYITVGRFLHNAYERRNTTYVLTADQAVIVRRGFKHSVSYRSLGTIGEVETNFESDGTGSIVFEAAIRTRGKSRATSSTGLDGFQFFRIDDAQVFQLLRTETAMALPQRDSTGDSELTDTPGWRPASQGPYGTATPPSPDGRPAPWPGH